MAESSRTEDPFVTALHKHLPQVLPEFLAGRRWFGGKARRMRAVEVLDVVPVDRQALPGYLVLVRVSHDTGTDDIYDVPLVRLPAGAPASIPDPASILTFRHEAASEDIMLVDALSDDPFLACLLDAIAKGATFPGTRGEVRGVSTKALATLWQPPRGPLAASLMKAEQSNSSVVYGQRFVLKIFRRVEEGINPDLEIGLYLTEHTSFQNVPAVAGHLEYLSADGARTSLGELQGYVANQGDAWQFTVRALAEYYEKARQAGSLAANEVPQESILALAELSIPAGVERRIGPYLESAALLGRRTAELHMALASARKDPAFTPAPLSEAEQQAFATSALQLVTTNFGLLRFEGRGHMKVEMPDPVRRKANTVLSLEGNARQHFQRFAGRKLSAMLTRIHGDYHLGQVLFTGDDFVLIDFEGEPARSLEERRQKRSPLQDVAGMLRSFHYAAYAPLLQSTGQGLDEDLQALGRWAYYWQKSVSAAFLKTYLEVSRDAQFIPQSREELAFLLDAYVLDKAVYELGYELNNRPSWLRIPLEGIAQLLLGPGEALL
jgi:maltose alpha-D-glucosyltransferase/alpha-amylase